MKKFRAEHFIIFSTIAIILIIAFFFHQKGFSIFNDGELNFNAIGAYSSLISSITSPLLTVIGAIFLIRTYRFQIEQVKNDTFLKELEMLKNNFNNTMISINKCEHELLKIKSEINSIEKLYEYLKSVNLNRKGLLYNNQHETMKPLMEDLFFSEMYYHAIVHLQYILVFQAEHISTIRNSFSNLITYSQFIDKSMIDLKINELEYISNKIQRLNNNWDEIFTSHIITNMINFNKTYGKYRLLQENFY